MCIIERYLIRKGEVIMLYIISQVFVIISYALLACTYFGKDKKKILIMSFGAVVCNAIAYSLLGAVSGVIMSFVAIARNIVFLVREGKEKAQYIDWLILIVLSLVIIVFSCFTYAGVFSLFSGFGTLIYTYSAWQKSPNNYKILGVPASLCWIIYNAYVGSLFGIILESILFVFEIGGIIKMIKDSKMIKTLN